MTPYENLANGIILQAVTDYRKALRGRKCHPYRKPGKTLKECEKFFLSDWFRCLTKVDGQYLIEKLRREVEDESNSGARNTKPNRNYRTNSVYMLRQ